MNLNFESQRYSTDENCELASDSFNMRKLQFYFEVIFICVMKQPQKRCKFLQERQITFIRSDGSIFCSVILITLLLIKIKCANAVLIPVIRTTFLS